jgi:hypothetical protein
VLAIQVLLIAAVLVVAARLLRGQGARHQAIRRLMLVLFAIAAVLSILFPKTWTSLAQSVGVGRGADLLLYSLMVAFLGFVATSYRRFRELEARFTQLARRIALDEVAPPGPDGARPPLPGGPSPEEHGPRH